MLFEQRPEGSKRVSNGDFWGRGVQAEGTASAVALKQGRACRDVMKERHESQRDLSIMSDEKLVSSKRVQSDGRMPGGPCHGGSHGPYSGLWNIL